MAIMYNGQLKGKRSMNSKEGCFKIDFYQERK